MIIQITEENIDYCNLVLLSLPDAYIRDHQIGIRFLN
jgi:hypothetical protein